MGRIVDPRTWLEHISTRGCWDLLAAQKVARLAVVVDRRPQIFPINIAVSEDQRIVFRTAAGTKLEALGDLPDVALEVDGTDDEAASGWSVLVAGSAHHVMDATSIAAFERLDLEPWAPGHKLSWVAITAASVSGRRINPPAAD